MDVHLASGSRRRAFPSVGDWKINRSECGEHSAPSLAETSRLRIGNSIRLTIFIVLVVLPLPWVWINPTREDY